MQSIQRTGVQVSIRGMKVLIYRKVTFYCHTMVCILLSRVDCIVALHREISTCILKRFCPTGSRLLLDIMTTQMKVQDSWQWNSGVQSSMCGFFLLTF